MLGRPTSPSTDQQDHVRAKRAQGVSLGVLAKELEVRRSAIHRAEKKPTLAGQSMAPNGCYINQKIGGLDYQRGINFTHPAERMVVRDHRESVEGENNPSPGPQSSESYVQLCATIRAWWAVCIGPRPTMRGNVWGFRRIPKPRDVLELFTPRGRRPLHPHFA